MILRKAIEVLKTYQTWRLGAEIEMIQPKVLTEALDVVLNFTDSPEFGFAESRVERMYSEEDLREAFKQSRQALIFEKDMPPVYENFEDWFKAFKKQETS